MITGGTAGVGRAVGDLYARRRWRVGLIARGTERLDQASQALRSLGAEQTASVSADVADAAAVERAADIIEQELGPIAVWINCAMVTIYASFSAIEPSEFERVTRVVYLGAVNGTRAALTRMRGRGSGAIVCVGSALAYRSIPLQSAYCGAKFALRGFLELLRSELLHDEVPVSISMVQLPGVNTPQFDWGRNKLKHRPRPAGAPCQPEVAARAVARAADEGVRELIVGRSSAEVLLGNMTMPAVLDRIFARSGYSGQQTKEPADPGVPTICSPPRPTRAARTEGSTARPVTTPSS